MKKCNKCLKEQELNNFPKNLNSPDGYRNTCKNCRNLIRRYIDTKINNKPVNIVSKICCTCKETKLSTDFYKDCKKPDGYNPRCKPCFKLQAYKKD